MPSLADSGGTRIYPYPWAAAVGDIRTLQGMNFDQKKKVTSKIITIFDVLIKFSTGDGKIP